MNHTSARSCSSANIFMCNVHDNLVCDLILYTHWIQFLTHCRPIQYDLTSLQTQIAFYSTVEWNSFNFFLLLTECKWTGIVSILRTLSISLSFTQTWGRKSQTIFKALISIWLNLLCTYICTINFDVYHFVYITIDRHKCSFFCIYLLCVKRFDW